jgi:hypothetical protein
VEPSPSEENILRAGTKISGDGWITSFSLQFGRIDGERSSMPNTTRSRAAVIVSNTEIAASGAKINTHVPTPDEIAKRKYVIRRYRSPRPPMNVR